jgi:hypothetical protein
MTGLFNPFEDDPTNRPREHPQRTPQHAHEYQVGGGGEDHDAFSNSASMTTRTGNRSMSRRSNIQ